MRQYNNDPRIIKARFKSECNETGQTINRGEECIYYPRSKTVFSMDSEQAKDFKRMQFDNQVLGCNY